MASSCGTVKAFGLFSLSPSSRPKVLYDPKAFIAHAASHCQAFAHCKRSSTAASRRSLGSVSVPVWLTNLSVQLPVKRLGRPLPYQLADGTQAPPRSIAWLSPEATFDRSTMQHRDVIRY